MTYDSSRLIQKLLKQAQMLFAGSWEINYLAHGTRLGCVMVFAWLFSRCFGLGSGTGWRLSLLFSSVCFLLCLETKHRFLVIQGTKSWSNWPWGGSPWIEAPWSSRKLTSCRLAGPGESRHPRQPAFTIMEWISCHCIVRIWFTERKSQARSLTMWKLLGQDLQILLIVVEF